MKNRIQDGESASEFSYVNATGSTIAAGAVVKIGGRFGVAVTEMLNGETGAVYTTGRFRLAKASGVALAQGRGLGWDVSNSRITTDMAAEKLGEVATAALSGDLFVEVNLVNTRRVVSLTITPSAAQDTANQVDVVTGFGNDPTGAVQAIIWNSSGTTRPVTTITYPAAGTVRLAEANIAATDKVMFTAHE